MREIKFRGLDKNGIWRFGYYHAVHEAIQTYHYIRESSSDKRIDPATLGQYTGLKDKNGREIYEGDVVRFLNGETTSSESGMDCEEFNTDGVIFWDDESAQWDITHRIDVSREDVFTDISEYEIISNIYQKPGITLKQ